MVVDGFSLYYALAFEVRRKGIEKLFYYDSVRQVVFQFMNYLSAKNIVIDCICIDTLTDPLKLEEYYSRAVRREKDYSRVWDSGFRSVCRDVVLDSL